MSGKKRGVRSRFRKCYDLLATEDRGGGEEAYMVVYLDCVGRGRSSTLIIHSFDIESFILIVSCVSIGNLQKLLKEQHKKLAVL